jgi:integrase/recombinase XerD
MPYGRFPIPRLLERDWPEADRRAWGQARRSGDIFDVPGPAAHWSPGTARQNADAYGGWLGWLEAKGLLSATSAPDERVTKERVETYTAELAVHLAPVSVERRITLLRLMIKVLVPGFEPGWLKRGSARLAVRSRPTREKAGRIPHTAALVNAGMTEMAAAIDAPELSDGERCKMHLNGLIVAFLAMRPIRLNNLLAMDLDRHVIVDGRAVTVAFAASELKNRRPLRFAWPDSLREHLDIYLNRFRPMLLSAGSTSALWISRDGRRLTTKSAQTRIEGVTDRWIGVRTPPHWFRDAAATTIAVEAPADVDIIKSVLGHAVHRTSEKHYNHARGLEATRRHQESIEALRAEIVAKTRKAGRR